MVTVIPYVRELNRKAVAVLTNGRHMTEKKVARWAKGGWRPNL